MRNVKNQLWLLLALSFSILACKNSKPADSKTSSDIPATSKSEEAKKSFREGLAYADDANTVKAKAAFTNAIEQDSTLAIAYMYRANFSQTTKEFMDDLQKAGAHLDGVSDWEKMYYDFQRTFVNNDWDKRLEIAKKIADANPGAARAQVDLGSTYQGGNQVENERAAFQKAIDLDPKWVGGYNALINSYINSEPKDFKKAEENALKVVELAPKSSNAEIALGDCYRAEDDLEKARASYVKAVALNPDEPTGYYKKGHVNSFLGNYDEARMDYTEGAKRDVSSIGANQFIALTYLYAGDHDAAMKLLMEDVGKAQSADEKLTYLSACALICLQNGYETNLRGVIGLMKAPSDQVASDIGSAEEALLQKERLLFFEALADAMEGKLDEAKTKAEEMKTTLEPIKNPTKLQSYEMALGYIAMKEDKYADAVDHFEKADQNSVYTRYWLAMANEAAGNKDKANQLFKEVSVYNFNAVDYAAIRNEVKKKVGTP